jgi:hypothetical protein
MLGSELGGAGKTRRIEQVVLTQGASCLLLGFVPLIYSSGRSFRKFLGVIGPRMGVSFACTAVCLGV